MYFSDQMGSKGGGGLFRYADQVDKLLMIFGTIGSIGDGMMTPLVLFILSGLIGRYGTADVSISIKDVNKVCIHLSNRINLSMILKLSE